MHKALDIANQILWTLFALRLADMHLWHKRKVTLRIRHVAFGSNGVTWSTAVALWHSLWANHTHPHTHTETSATFELRAKRIFSPVVSTSALLCSAWRLPFAAVCPLIVLLFVAKCQSWDWLEKIGIGIGNERERVHTIYLSSHWWITGKLDSIYTYIHTIVMYVCVYTAESVYITEAHKVWFNEMSCYLYAR